MRSKIKKGLLREIFEGKFQRPPGEVYSRLQPRAPLERKTKTKESMRVNWRRNLIERRVEKRLQNDFREFYCKILQ